MDDRKPNMQGWTDLSREIGLPCIVTDPDIAATATRRVHEGGAAGPVPHAAVPAIPGPVAFSRAGDPLAGAIAINGQVTVRTARSGLLDDVVGRGWQLITTDAAVVERCLDAASELLLESIGATVVVGRRARAAERAGDRRRRHVRGWFADHGQRRGSGPTRLLPLRRARPTPRTSTASLDALHRRRCRRRARA